MPSENNLCTLFSKYKSLRVLKGPKLENFGSKFLKSPKPIWVVHFRRRRRNNYVTFDAKSSAKIVLKG
jgi:hypothetical protein